MLIFRQRADDVPAQSDIQSQAAAHFPVIRHIERRIPDVRIRVHRRNIHGGAVGGAEQETRERITSRGESVRVRRLVGTKLEAARCATAVILIVIILADLDPKPDIVLAVYPGSVVLDNVTAVRLHAGIVAPERGESATLVTGAGELYEREGGLRNACKSDLAGPTLVQAGRAVGITHVAV